MSAQDRESLRPPLHVVVMGVSATGKTSVAEELANQLALDFVEGDDMHPPANIDKMSAGVPLDDDDRRPWLQAIADRVAEQDRTGRSAVVTCSALKRSYRDILRSGLVDSDIFFLHLHTEFDVLHDRMTQRTKHFMPPALLQSQFDTLEPLQDDEAGAVVDVAEPLEVVVTASVKAVRTAYPGWHARPGD